MIILFRIVQDGKGVYVARALHGLIDNAYFEDVLGCSIVSPRENKNDLKESLLIQELEISELPNGVYLIQIINKKGEKIIKKFVVMNK